MRRIFFASIAMLLLLTAGGCSTRYVKLDTHPDAVPVTPEMLEEISREIFTETGALTSAPEETEPIPEETLPPLTDETTVYWLLGGKVCHVFPTCRYIRDREEVQSGTLTEARELGKDKVCSVCYPADDS